MIFWMASFFFVLIHFVRPKKHEKAKLKFPNELLAEIITFFPLNSKFVDLHVSLGFDLFLLKNLGHYIVSFKKRVYPYRNLLNQIYDRVTVINDTIGDTPLATLKLLAKKLYALWPQFKNHFSYIDLNSFQTATFIYDFANIQFGNRADYVRSSVSAMCLLYKRVITAMLQLNNDTLFPINQFELEHMSYGWEVALNNLNNN